METTVNLNELLRDLAAFSVEGTTDIAVRGLAHHSDKLEPGFIFFCLKGSKSDGHHYIDKAVRAGAVAVVVEKEVRVEGATKIRVPNVRLSMSAISEKFYGFPSQTMRLIGVTGTNGKTTTTYLIENTLAAAGLKTGLLGTVKFKAAGENLPVLATTPEAPDLQNLFRLMLDKGVSHAVMEVSSHALELNRVAGCDFNIAVHTNVSEDHLDFHQDFQRYLSAKGKLFAQMGGSFYKGSRPRYAVLNMDDRHYGYLLRQVTVQPVTYGLHENAMVRAEDITLAKEGICFKLVSPWGEERLALKLVGKFSVYNALAAATVCLLEGVELQVIKNSLEAVEGIPGRFERVDLGQDYLVVVDYAHTPDGLENILQAANNFVEGRIITIFGCGGDRDRTKRPIMGKIAAYYSDYCIVTSDNPRGEDPFQIIREIEPGLQAAGKKNRYTVQVDRYEAIRLGIELAKSDDIVIIAGKGHENYQVFSDHTLPFSDREAAEEIIKNRLGMQ